MTSAGGPPTDAEAGAFPADQWLEVGRSRRDLHTEDRVLVNVGVQVFGVFDGVGSGGHGAQAARLALDAVEAAAARHPVPPTTVRQAQRLLAQALAEADEAIAEMNRQHVGERSDATTAAIALIFRPVRLAHPGYVAVLATLGDSRVQLLRDGHLHTLTLDHSAIGDPDPASAKDRQDRLDEAQSWDDLLTPLDKAAFTQRHLICCALDGTGHDDARFYALRLVAGDRLLIDSDGVHDNLRGNELAALAASASSPQQAADSVADAAWERSNQDPQSEPRAKPDDVSIVVIDVNAG